jgi:hypothetical protein
MTSLPLQGLYGACKVPSLFRKRENERRSLNIRRCSARVGNYSGTTAVGGPLPFRSRRSTTACPPTCAIPVAICDRRLTSTRDIAPRLKCANTGHSARARRMGQVDTQRTSFDCGVRALQRFARQRGRFSRSPSRDSPAIFQVKEGFPTRRPAKTVCLCRAGTDYVRQPRPWNRATSAARSRIGGRERHARGFAFRHRRFKRDQATGKAGLRLTSGGNTADNRRERQ